MKFSQGSALHFRGVCRTSADASKRFARTLPPDVFFSALIDLNYGLMSIVTGRA